jgi:hypothetical protein
VASSIDAECKQHADTVVPWIGGTRLGHLKCALAIGTRSAQSIGGTSAASIGRTPPDQCCRNVRKFLPRRRPHASQSGGRAFRRNGSPAGGAYDFFIIIVIRHETTAAAGGALLLIVRTLFNYAITVALWTGFHVFLPVDAFASLTRRAEENLQSQSYSHSVRRSALVPRSFLPKPH